MPRRDPAVVQRRRERAERIKREKEHKLSAQITDQGRATLDLVLDGGKGSAPATNLPKAIADFDEALKKNDQNADALFLRGRCQQELGDLDKATADYAACLAVQPTHVAALLQQAICFEAQGDADRAIANYTAIVEVDPRHDAAYNMRGCARLARRGGLGLKLRHADFTSVEADFLAALRCNENNFHALCNLGRLYDEHGMYDAAVTHYTRAMDVKDDYGYAAYRRGRSALTAVEEALRRAELGIAADPADIVVAESCAAVPAPSTAPKDPRRIEPPKGTPQSVFTLPPIGPGKSKAQQQQQQQQQRAGALGGGAAGRAPSAGSALNDAGDADAAMERAARAQVERELAEERQFAQLKHFLATAIADFSRVVAPLEPEERVRELPALVHRASCYLYDGDMERAEEDVAFVRKSLDAYKDLQPPPATTADSLRAALPLLLARLDAARQRRRQGLPISPFASGGISLAAAVKKMS
jgi:hypothetical protein